MIRYGTWEFDMHSKADRNQLSLTSSVKVKNLNDLNGNTWSKIKVNKLICHIIRENIFFQFGQYFNLCCGHVVVSLPVF